MCPPEGALFTPCTASPLPLFQELSQLVWGLSRLAFRPNERFLTAAAEAAARLNAADRLNDTDVSEGVVAPAAHTYRSHLYEFLV